MNPVIGPHPDAAKLQAYGLGKLDCEESAGIEEHVAFCGSCCRAIETLLDDSLLALLHAPGGLTGQRTTEGGDAAPKRTAVGVPPELTEHPRYRVEAVLGSGGMGVVYKAEHRLMQRPVALKVIKRSLTEDPAVVERFQREVRAAARLTHPNIVTAYDADQAGETHFLVMELVQGTTLAWVVTEHGPLAAAQACDCARQAALGLQYAFEHGLVHRDIKPQNLMLTPDGCVKILDFGLARLASEVSPPEDSDPALRAGETVVGSSVTATSTVVDTADYVAPEQVADAHTADIRADLYSLGCTLYFLLTGLPPFPEGTIRQKLRAHGERGPRPLGMLREGLPVGLERVVRRLLAKEATQRYQTPAEVAQALAPFARKADSRRRRWWLPAGAAGLLCLLTLSVYLGGPAILRLVTNQGLLVIETDDPDAQVIVLQSGERVRILDALANRRVDLPTGSYQFELATGRADRELAPRELTLPRGGTAVLAIRPVPGFVGEVRRLSEHTDWVQCVVFSPDGCQALSGSRDKTVRLWNLERGKSRCVGAHKDFVWSVAFSPDGHSALSGSGGDYRNGEWSLGSDHTLRWWDLDSGRCLALMPHKYWVHGVAFFPNGRQALACGERGSLQVWDLESAAELRPFVGHEDYAGCVAVSRDGRRVLSGSNKKDGTVRWWDAETRTELRCLLGHEDNIISVALSPDGRQALSASWDCTLRLWDLESGEERRCHKHHGQVLSVAFSPDGRRALWGDQNGAVRLWDVIAWKQLDVFKGHTGQVLSVAFSPDGRRAVSGSADHTVRLWGLPPAD